jgi:hypothetical protein
MQGKYTVDGTPIGESTATLKISPPRVFLRG